MSFFNIDYSVLRVQLLPVRLRTTFMKAWVECLVKPIEHIQQHFLSARNTDIYRLAHNGQVCYLEATLNDMFDHAERRIFITDGPFIDPLHIYLDPENKPLIIGTVAEIGSESYAPRWLYTMGETMEFSWAFIVNVPETVVYDTDKMRALIDRDKLVGKTYDIVTF